MCWTLRKGPLGTGRGRSQINKAGRDWSLGFPEAVLASSPWRVKEEPPHGSRLGRRCTFPFSFTVLEVRWVQLSEKKVPLSHLALGQLPHASQTLSLQWLLSLENKTGLLLPPRWQDSSQMGVLGLEISHKEGKLSEPLSFYAIRMDFGSAYVLSKTSIPCLSQGHAATGSCEPQS